MAMTDINKMSSGIYAAQKMITCLTWFSLSIFSLHSTTDSLNDINQINKFHTVATNNNPMDMSITNILSLKTQRYKQLFV